VTEGVLKIARRIWEVGVAGSPVIGRRRGAFSTLLRRPGLRASSDGALAAKHESKNVSEYTLVLAVCLVVESEAETSEQLLVEGATGTGSASEASAGGTASVKQGPS